MEVRQRSGISIVGWNKHLQATAAAALSTAAGINVLVTSNTIWVLMMVTDLSRKREAALTRLASSPQEAARGPCRSFCHQEADPVIECAISSVKDRSLSPPLLAAIAVVLLVLLTAWPGRAQLDPTLDQSLDEPRTEEPYLRWRWFYEQRAYPLKRIEPGEMHRARRYLRKGVASQALPKAPPVGGNRWEGIGPAPILGDRGYAQTGRIDSIAVHPVNANIIYVGAAEGGVWRTTNRGASWTPLTDHAPSLAMGP